MIQRLRNLFIDFWVVLAFGLAAALLMPQAHAGLIGTEAAAAQDERMRVKAMLERPELAKGLAEAGIDADARRRRASTRWATARCFSSPASSTPRSRPGRSATRRCC